MILKMGNMLKSLNGVFLVQGAVGFCLAVQPTDGDIGTIGRKCILVKTSDFYYENQLVLCHYFIPGTLFHLVGIM